jgi:hypothetical protein
VVQADGVAPDAGTGDPTTDTADVTAAGDGWGSTVTVASDADNADVAVATVVGTAVDVAEVVVAVAAGTTLDTGALVTAEPAEITAVAGGRFACGEPQLESKLTTITNPTIIVVAD